MKPTALNRSEKKDARDCLIEDIEEDGLTLLERHCFEQGFRAGTKWAVPNRLAIDEEMRRFVERTMRGRGK